MTMDSQPPETGPQAAGPQGAGPNPAAAPVSADGLIARVKAILLRPTPTWDVIDTETASIRDLFVRYALILAAIGPICGLIGSQVFGVGVFGFHYRPHILGAVIGAVVNYGLALAGVAVLGFIIDALAPSFGGVKNRVQAFKVAIYSSTAMWIASVFGLIPFLGVLSIVGLYSLYLLYLGLPKLMKSPKEQALPYTIVTIICAVVIGVVISIISAPIMIASAGLGALGATSTPFASTNNNVRITTPSGAVIDTAAMEKAAKEMEAAANGKGKPVVPSATLAALLPASLGGLPRTETNSTSGGLGDIQSSTASAVYSAGEKRIELSVTDMAAMGGLAAMGGMLNLESSSESNGRYEKVGQVDGRLTTETWDSNDRSGDYSVVIANRVMVKAEGNDVDMAALKAAVASVDARRIETLAR